MMHYANVTSSFDEYLAMGEKEIMFYLSNQTIMHKITLTTLLELLKFKCNIFQFVQSIANIPIFK